MYTILILILSLVLSFAVYFFNTTLALFLLIIGGALLLRALEKILSEDFFEMKPYIIISYSVGLIFLNVIYKANYLFVLYHSLFTLFYLIIYFTNESKNDEKVSEYAEYTETTDFTEMNNQYEDINPTKLKSTNYLKEEEKEFNQQKINDYILEIEESINHSKKEIKRINIKEKRVGQLPFTGEATIETLKSERQKYDSKIKKYDTIIQDLKKKKTGLEESEQHFFNLSLEQEKTIRKLKEELENELNDLITENDNFKKSNADLEEKLNIAENKNEQLEKEIKKNLKRKRKNNLKKDWESIFKNMSFQPRIFNDVKRYKNPADIRKLEHALVELSITQDRASLSRGKLKSTGKDAPHHMGVRLKDVEARIKFRVVNDSRKPVEILRIYDHSNCEEFK